MWSFLFLRPPVQIALVAAAISAAIGARCTVAAFLIVMRNTRLCEQALRCLRQQGACHFIYGSFFARRAKNKP